LGPGSWLKDKKKTELKNEYRNLFKVETEYGKIGTIIYIVKDHARGE
jgi:hypothetical protein